MNSDKYWFHNLQILTRNYQNIIPRKDMTYPEKVNSLVRTSIIIGIVLSIVYYNHLFLYIPVITMIMTYILYLFREQELNTQLNNQNNNLNNNLNNNPNKLDRLPRNSKSMINKELLDKFEGYLDDVNYTQPDKENPFMNAMPFDNRHRTPAARTVGNPVKQAEIEVTFDNGTFRDVNDVFDKNNGKRQFFTMPYTTFPNDQGGFANWLYKTPPTCKEGNGAQCVANYHTPLNRNLLTPGVGSSP